MAQQKEIQAQFIVIIYIWVAISITFRAFDIF